MKCITLLAGLALLAVANFALALDIQPYSPEKLAAMQKAGASFALHFHADWCPTCKAQDKVFNGWKDDASVPGTLLIVDYDKERVLKRQLGVRIQSTVIAYKGAKETGRLAGDTDPKALRALLDSAK